MSKVSGSSSSGSTALEVIDYDEHSNTIVSLFGCLHLLDTGFLSVSFVIIMIFVMGIEWIFHRLHQLTEDTAFYSMITAIQKELMIVGFMAFMLKVIVNAQENINHDWYSAIEFADLIIPITSMIYLSIGLLLMYLQTIQTKLWSKAYNLSLIEIFDEYSSSMSKGNKFPSFFGNEALEQMEFRILHHIFCEEYKIKENACPFDKYSEMCYEKYLISVLTISPSNWCFIIVWVLLNLLRQKLHIEIYECDHHSSHYEDCFKERSLIMFSFFGGLLFFIACILGGLSRLYIVRMLRGKGIYNQSEYITFLQLMESVASITSKDESQDQQKISSAELKEALAYAKNKKVDKAKDKQDDNKYFGETKRKSVTPTLSAGSRRTVMLFDALVPQRSISSYFIFSKPQWYFNIIDGLIMPVAFYGSLWVCNFCIWSYYAERSSMYMAISLIPLILTIVLIIYIIRSAALLRLVTSLDADTLQEAIENAESSNEIADNLRTKILSRLNEIGSDDELQLKILFQQIDEDGSDLLSRAEFQEFLGNMKITFSKKKWAAIFAEIDKNYDDEIAFEELFIFLFPNHDKALAAERKRLQNLRKNVRERLLLQRQQQDGGTASSSRNLRGHSTSTRGFIFGSVFQTEEEFEVTKKRILTHMRLTDVKFHSIKQTAMLGSNLTNAPNPSDVDESAPFNNDEILNKPMSQAVNEDGNETEKVIPL